MKCIFFHFQYVKRKQYHNLFRGKSSQGQETFIASQIFMILLIVFSSLACRISRRSSSKRLSSEKHLLSWPPTVKPQDQV